MVHAYNPNTQKAEPEGYEYKTILGYLVKLSQKTQKRPQDRYTQYIQTSLYHTPSKSQLSFHFHHFIQWD